jgi:hypothetical protein
MGEGQTFTKDNSIDSFCICMRIENGMGCKKIGIKIPLRQVGHKS